MRFLTSGEAEDARDLPEWFKTIDCAHEYGLDPEVLMKKSVFWRDRMILVVEAKREARSRIDALNHQMRAQMSLTDGE